MNTVKQKLNVDKKSLKEMLSFGVIGGFGTLLNTLILWLLHSVGGMYYLVAAAIATEAAIIANFIGNHMFTFKDSADPKPLWKKFALFQGVSMFSLVGTLAILFALTSAFGTQLVLIWNLIAIGVMFVVNFALNKKFTWTTAKTAKVAIFALLTIGLFAAPALAEQVSISHLGYHPDSYKQVIVYTTEPTGTFTVLKGNKAELTGTLLKPTNYDGDAVNCQGNVPCLVGDFTSVTKKGTYTVETTFGDSRSFVISDDVYVDTIGVFDGFFEALEQQDSDFHADMHANLEVPFPAMADGSFLMTTDQAAVTTVRLGSAYRRNPELLGNDFAVHISNYIDYLTGLQGVEVSETPNGNLRLGEGVIIQNAFVPGPTNLTEIDVFIPGQYTSELLTVPVTSLCGANDDTAAWDACMDYAASYYKCQADEPCLNMTYDDKRGSVSATNTGFGLTKGWYYEFGCYFDVDVNEERYTNSNPCMIFNPEISGEATVLAFAAYAQAIPAVADLDSAKGQALVNRAIQTANYIESTTAASDPDLVAFYGMGLFLLYDYTGDAQYLTDAHAVRQTVSSTFVSDKTRGGEFYWEEYIRHENAMVAAGLTYQVSGQDPKEFFRGKMFGDFKDRGQLSIGQNGERIYELDPNIQFQNSRYQLTEGAIAAKTTDVYPGVESFVNEIAQSQVAWLTGANNVQTKASQNSPTKDMSFIFGIGDFPNEFHSRYLVNTGYFDATSGAITGARGTGYQFRLPNASASSTNAEDFVYFDGMHTIMGSTYGSLGNSYNGESYQEPFDQTTTFANGMDYIPGWINGAFDTNSETDVIYNYRDDINTYEHTETTNEIVATAVELWAYLDAQQNNRAPHNSVTYNFTGPTLPPTNVTNTTGQIDVFTTPSGAIVRVNGIVSGLSPMQMTKTAGQYTVSVNKTGYLANSTVVNVTAGSTINVLLDLYASTTPTNNTTNTTTPTNNTNTTNTTSPVQNASFTLTTSPGAVKVYVDGTLMNTSTAAGAVKVYSVATGTHTLSLQKTGYTTASEQVTLSAGNNNLGTRTLDQTPKSGVVIMTSDTMLGGSSPYFMFDAQTTTFMVTTNQSGTVTWTLPSATGSVTKTTNGTNHNMTWTPGISFHNSQGAKEATIVATASNTSASWDVNVDDAINVFFSGPDVSPASGGQPIEIVVITDNDMEAFSSVTATMQANQGGSTVTKNYVLTQKFVQDDETEWRATIPQTDLQYGNNIVKTITGVNNETNTTISVSGDGRSHYKESPVSNRKSESSSSSRTSSSGGGGLAFRSFIPDMVYILVEEGVVGMQEEQTITLDMRSFENEIQFVTAVVADQNGNAMDVDLELIDGSRSYGTWSASFSGFENSGQHIITEVIVENYRNDVKSINVTNTSFYVVSDEVAANESLNIVYSVLSKSTVESGSMVILRLDARDSVGIESITATVANTKTDDQQITLNRISGDASYGTYEGIFEASEPDSTYSVIGITLSNGLERKTYEVDDREVYVKGLPNSGNRLTGGVVGSSGAFIFSSIEEALKHPMTPAIIGGLILVIGLLGVFAKDATMRLFSK